MKRNPITDDIAFIWPDRKIEDADNESRNVQNPGEHDGLVSRSGLGCHVVGYINKHRKGTDVGFEQRRPVEIHEHPVVDSSVH